MITFKGLFPKTPEQHCYQPQRGIITPSTGEKLPALYFPGQGFITLCYPEGEYSSTLDVAGYEVHTVSDQNGPEKLIFESKKDPKAQIHMILIPFLSE